MKLIGISGSPRNKNTNYMLRTVLDATNQEYELVLLKDKKIEPCTACKGCYESHKCVINDDMKGLLDKLLEADAVALGSPTYFDNVTGIMKNFMDRCLPLYLSKSLQGKKVVLITVGNYKGGEFLRGTSDINQSLEEGSVRNCLKEMEMYCKHLGLEIVGSVYAIRGNPEAKRQELIQLGRRLIS